MKNFSEVTGLQYEDEECVFFRNHVQSAKYVSWGAKLVDIFTDSDDKFVFVFTKADHEKYKLRWGTNKKEDNNG